MSSTVTNRFSEWLVSRQGKCVVAGPCSVETEQQIMDAGLELAKYDVNLLRGGIWKPRTHPGSFEGVGEKGLKWLKSAGDVAGLPVGTEVACAAHVERCLQSDIDVLWLGARTTTSPIAVQEIADSLLGVDIPVMLKNPMNPDIELWIGAIERLLKAGVKRVVAVHRGFSTHTKYKYRNRPLWRIPLELRRRLPGIPILCDPSHISGTRKYIASIAQDALEIGLDGLMIESHCHPEAALSDAEQQLPPMECGRLLQQLKHSSRMKVPDPGQELSNLWREIDDVDEDLSMLFSQRLSILRKVERIRQKQNEFAGNGCLCNSVPGAWEHN